MTEPLNTYGLKPALPQWKFFQVEGWQLLVSLRENEDDDTRSDVVFETAVDGPFDGVSVRLTMPHAQARDAFDAYDNGEVENAPRKALQMLLDQSGPLLRRMGGGE